MAFHIRKFKYKEINISKFIMEYENSTGLLQPSQDLFEFEITNLKTGIMFGTFSVLMY